MNEHLVRNNNYKRFTNYSIHPLETRILKFKEKKCNCIYY